MKKKSVSRIIVGILLALIAFIWVIPFLWTLLTSLKDNSEIYTDVLKVFPSHLYFGHYASIFTKLGNFFKYFRNSVIVSFWSVLFNVLFAATLGYSLQSSSITEGESSLDLSSWLLPCPTSSI